jgi:hypothetical protein
VDSLDFRQQRGAPAPALWTFHRYFISQSCDDDLAVTDILGTMVGQEINAEDARASHTVAPDLKQIVRTR